MEAIIDYRPERDRYILYIGTSDAAMYWVDGELKVQMLKPGDERHPFAEWT